MNHVTMHKDSAIDATSGGTLINLEHLPFATDSGIGARAAIGLLVLETDQTIEDEFRAIWPRDGVALYATRLHNDVMITPETLMKMKAEIPPAAKLLPFMTDFQVIAFACTSGALVIGEDTVAELIHSVKPGVKVTAYLKEINERLRNSLIERGLNIPVMGSFNEADDDVVARMTPDAIRDAIVKIGSLPDCDGVFVSCTSLRVAKIAEEAEALIGKPVTSSNHALAWHMLRLAGIEDEIPGFGRLFRTKLKS